MFVCVIKRTCVFQSEESELSYKKWLTPTRTDWTTDDKMLSDERHSSAQNRQHHKKGKKSEQAKYVFLTEKQATTPGQFSKRRKELEETRGCPAAHSTQLPPVQKQKSYSAMAMLGNDGCLSPRSPTASKPGMMSCFMV